MKEQILLLKEQGKSYNEIQQELGCSKGTISYHLGAGQKQKAKIRAIKNKAAKISAQKQTRKKLKEFVDRYKTICGCSKCGIKNPVVLEFDHIEPQNKSFSICELWKWSSSMELLKQEIRKCQILCANCHRIKTFNQNDY